eukprot:295242-Chlamydomonas_euryale.AAC.9
MRAVLRSLRLQVACAAGPTAATATYLPSQREKLRCICVASHHYFIHSVKYAAQHAHPACCGDIVRACGLLNFTIVADCGVWSSSPPSWLPLIGDDILSV